MNEQQAFPYPTPWTVKERDLRLEALQLAVATGVAPSGVVKLADSLLAWLLGRGQSND